MFILQKLHHELLQVMLSCGAIPINKAKDDESCDRYEVSITVGENNNFGIIGTFRCIGNYWTRKGISAWKIDDKGNHVRSKIYYYSPEVGDVITLTQNNFIHIKLVTDRLNLAPVQDIDYISINPRYQDLKGSIIPIFAGISVILWLGLLINLFQ